MDKSGLVTTWATLGGGQACLIDACVNVCLETQVVVKRMKPEKTSAINNTSLTIPMTPPQSGLILSGPSAIAAETPLYAQ